MHVDLGEAEISIGSATLPPSIVFAFGAVQQVSI
jgi:hypothetical protein